MPNHLTLFTATEEHHTVTKRNIQTINHVLMKILKRGCIRRKLYLQFCNCSCATKTDSFFLLLNH